MKTKTLLLIVLVMLSPARAHTSNLVEVIDTPTANSVDFGSYAISFRLYDAGSILTRLHYGIIMKNLTLGVSFDAKNVVGSQDIEPRRPYLFVKLPLYSGNLFWPAVSIGFDEQGFGQYDEAREEYLFSPMGFFFVISKTEVAKGLNVSAGANADYSINENAKKVVKGFFNIDFTVGPSFILLTEIREIQKDGTYVNAGAKYFLNEDLNFEFSVLNIGSGSDVSRIIRITYAGMF